jgi:3-deoxy-D-manno-octulosonic-acid transferase
MPLMLLAYNLALWLLLPFIFLRLLWRSRRQPEYLQHVPERFGFYSLTVDAPVIWLHAVSVGETRALQALVFRIRDRFPDHQILLTHTTPTGRSASAQIFGDAVRRVYLPYDYPFAVKRFLRHFRPRLGILVETEVWFNLIEAAHGMGIPLMLLNGRMSEKSARGYATLRWLARDAFGKMACVGAQTADDAQRLTSLGAKNVCVTGNLKFDVDPPASMLALGERFREMFGTSRKILLAASTREGEEALLLDSLSGLGIAGLLLVIVPRHPQRFDEVTQLVTGRHLKVQLRSEDRPVEHDTQVVIGDSMGEMFAFYSCADLAFVGGSLLPYGGQNLIEACAVGTPVIVGPHMHNFAEVTKQAVSAGAARQVADAGELASEVNLLFHSQQELHQMHLCCFEFVQANRGATDKSLQLIVEHCA